MAGPPSFLAAFDSAIMIMATASYLHGEPFPALGNPPAMKPIVKASGLLTTSLRQKAFIASGAMETVSPGGCPVSTSRRSRNGSPASTPTAGTRRWPSARRTGRW